MFCSHESPNLGRTFAVSLSFLPGQEGNSHFLMSRSRWQEVLPLTRHLPFTRPVNTASCVAIINAQRRPSLFLALNVSDLSSSINFGTPTAAYCWSERTHGREPEDETHTHTHALLPPVVSSMVGEERGGEAESVRTSKISHLNDRLRETPPR